MKYELAVIVPTFNEADNVLPLIEGLERLIAKKRLIKQGAMQELPHQARLPA